MDPRLSSEAPLSTVVEGTGSFAHTWPVVVKTEPVSPSPPEDPLPPMTEQPAWGEALDAVVKEEPDSPPPAGLPLMTPLFVLPVPVASAEIQQHQHVDHPELPQQAFVLPPPQHYVSVVAPASIHGTDSTEVLSLSERGENVPRTTQTAAAGDSSVANSTTPVQGGPQSPSASTSSPSISLHSEQSSHVAGAAVAPAAPEPRASTIWSALITPQGTIACGVLVLSDEEKRILKADGHAIPHRLPLSREEERALKNARKKIRNRISAQESRKRKQEYLHSLERKVTALTTENEAYKKKVAALENSCRSLKDELQEVKRAKRTVSTKSADAGKDIKIKEEIMDQY
ncbi:cyclic AMP-responsive element-binding protein 3-like protein 2 isoform X1 [Haemaphysalis longicornis]